MMYGARKEENTVETPKTEEWLTLSAEEKKKRLFEKQKALLDTFLAHGAISPAQYQKSLGDLRVKMGQ